MARSMWTAMAATAGALTLSACVGMGGQPAVRETNLCEDYTVSIYFETDSANLTAPATAIVRAAANRARACSNLRGVDVLGLADAPGDPAANQALSERRVQAVTRALAARGLSQVQFLTGAAGEAGAETRSGLDRPLRRRVDLALRFNR